MRSAKNVKLHNPALHAEPRNQQPAIIPPRQDSSLRDWLSEPGRLVVREASEHHHEEIEEKELEELMEKRGQDNEDNIPQSNRSW